MDSDTDSTRTSAGSSHCTCFPQQLWPCGPRNLYNVAAELLKLGPANQQMTLFSQLSLGLATKIHSVSIQQIPIANRDIQLGRAEKGTEKLNMQDTPSVVVPLSQRKDFKLFLSPQLTGYQTDGESRLELCKGCFEKQGLWEVESGIQPEEGFLLAPGRNASEFPAGDGNHSTYRSYDSANGMLVAASIEPVGARIYWKAHKAIAFVSFLASAEDTHSQLCAVCCLVAPAVALFAEVCNCMGENRWVKDVLHKDRPSLDF